MSDDVRSHYERYPYPLYPLAASVRRCDTYAINLDALWARVNLILPPPQARRILIAGCGSFSPYPFAVANPHIPITALDLSRRNTRRARLHCLLHGRYHVRFAVGDLCDPGVTSGDFGLIDAYGVLHHLNDPEAGLKALAERLVDGGIIRIMLYNRITRRLEESLRRTLRFMKIRDVRCVKSLIKRAKPGSRLERFATHCYDARSLSGLADALLHPCVHTFSVADCLALIQGAGLEPLLFAHAGALENVNAEIQRLLLLEAKSEAPGNFIVYLKRKNDTQTPASAGSLLRLNPCLKGSVCCLPWRKVRIPPRLGHPNPPIGSSEKHFLRRFTRPVPLDILSADEQDRASEYVKRFFLLRYAPD